MTTAGLIMAAGRYGMADGEDGAGVGADEVGDGAMEGLAAADSGVAGLADSMVAAGSVEAGSMAEAVMEAGEDTGKPDKAPDQGGASGRGE